MVLPGREQFEVRVSRWRLAFLTIISSTAAISLAVAVATFSQVTHLTVVSLVMTVAISAALATVWLRRRPFCVIDDQGITDCGVYSQGFGLIEWQNIESVVKCGSRAGISLLVRVNNYDDLLLRRNLLIKPLLLLSGGFLRFFGGQILLPVAWSNTDAETVRQQISRFSNNRAAMLN